MGVIANRRFLAQSEETLWLLYRVRGNLSPWWRCFLLGNVYALRLGLPLFVLKKHKINVPQDCDNGILLPNLWSFRLMTRGGSRVDIFPSEFSVHFVFDCVWPPPFKGKQTWLSSWLTAAFIPKFSLKERWAAGTLSLDVAALLERGDLGVGGVKSSLGSVGLQLLLSQF